MTYMHRSAVIDPSGLYRYRLERYWGLAGRVLCVMMLNPSTADGKVDDATIRKLIKFAMRQGYSGIMVVNLYAFRATKPEELFAALNLHGLPYVQGYENDRYIHRAVELCDDVLLAWGAQGAYLAQGSFYRGTIVRYIDEKNFFGPRRRKVYALNFTKSGEPVHPLYQRDDAPFIEVTS